VSSKRPGPSTRITLRYILEGSAHHSNHCERFNLIMEVLEAFYCHDVYNRFRSPKRTSKREITYIRISARTPTVLIGLSSRHILQITAQPLPSKSFPVHYSLILSFDPV
jgi:hypothetical protein